MNKGISVVLCCYNSAKRLQSTLEHLAKQKVPTQILWEIIIVDNNSDDNTTHFAKKIWENLHVSVPFKIISEQQQGLSFARKTGVVASKYKYILFCDDDNWLEENYIASAYEIMESNPQIGVLGSQSKVVSNGEIPFWFPSYQKDYAVGVQNIESGDVTFRRFVWGAGLVLRKSVLEKFYELNIYSLLTGRKEKQLLSGDDSEMCFWFIWSGYKLWYDENLVLQHFMPQNRLTKKYLKKMLEGHQEAQKYLTIYNIVTHHQPNSIFKYFLILVYLRLKTLLSKDALDYSNHKKIMHNYHVITQYFTKNRG